VAVRTYPDDADQVGAGIEARVRALLTDDEAGYLESIEQLARTGGRVQFARSHRSTESG